jgi:hypothetical protein
MIKAFAAKIYAALMHKKNQKWINNPLDAQTKVFKELIQKGLKTKFGKDHGFQKVTDTESFRASVPVRDYEELRPLYRSSFRRRSGCFMAWKAVVLRQVKRNHFWRKIHTYYGRFHASAHSSS